MKCEDCHIEDCVAKQGETEDVCISLPHIMTVEDILKTFNKAILNEKLLARITETKTTYYENEDSKDFYEVLIDFDHKPIYNSNTITVKMLDIEDKKLDCYDVLGVEVRMLGNGCGIDIVEKIIGKYFK